MKKIILVSSVFIFILLYGLYLSQFQLAVTQKKLSNENPDGFYDYRGLTHVHSLSSTGSGTYSEIIATAKKLNFDFIFFTEVNLDDQPRYLQGYDGDLLVLTGGEYSYIDSRLLYFGGSSNQPPKGKGQRQVYFADLLSQKASQKNEFLVLAHPFHSNYSWSGKYPEGLGGIEIINLKRVLEKAWVNSKASAIMSVFIYPFNSTLALLRLFDDPIDELNLWDKLNRKNKVVGFQGSDATAKAILTKNFSLDFPSYETSFAIASNHLLMPTELTGEVESDQQKVLNALHTGQFYMCMDILADPSGFSIKVISNKKKYTMGSTVPLHKDSKLIVDLPENLKVPFEIKIYKDGEHYSTSNSIKSVLDLHAPGNYRAVVRVIPTFPLPGGKRWFSWIYTNSFYVR